MKSLLNRFFIFVFCFRQQPFYSTELNSTSETKSCQCHSAVELQSSYSRATVEPAQHGNSTTFETGVSDYSVNDTFGIFISRDHGFGPPCESPMLPGCLCAQFLAKQRYFSLVFYLWRERYTDVSGLAYLRLGKYPHFLTSLVRESSFFSIRPSTEINARDIKMATRESGATVGACRACTTQLTRK